MKAKLMRGLSTACMVMGDLSLLGSVALYALGRARNDKALRSDGIFVGLWVPTFYILSDRAAMAAQEHEAAAELVIVETLGPAETMLDQYELAQAQSPRPMSYVNREF